MRRRRLGQLSTVVLMRQMRAANVEAVRPYLALDHFTPEHMQKKSRAAHSLCLYVVGLVKLYDIVGGTAGAAAGAAPVAAASAKPAAASGGASRASGGTGGSIGNGSWNDRCVLERNWNTAFHKPPTPKVLTHKSL